MRAWTYAIAIVGALLLSSSALLADAPSDTASANAANMSVEEEGAGDGGSSDNTEGMSRRDLSELARQLRESQGRSSGSAEADSTEEAEAAGADGGAESRSRSSEATGGEATEDQPLGLPGASSAAGGDDSVFSGTGSMVLNTLTALGLVIGLILLLRWAWTRLSGQPSVTNSSVVEVLARTPVAPRNHVLLVRVANRVLILGDSPAGLRTLGSVDDPDEIADLLTNVTSSQDNSITRGFNQLLNRFQGDYETDTVGEVEGGASLPRHLHFAEDGGDRQEHAVDRARDSVSSLMSRLRTMGSTASGSGVERSVRKGGRR